MRHLGLLSGLCAREFGGFGFLDGFLLFEGFALSGRFRVFVGLGLVGGNPGVLCSLGSRRGLCPFSLCGRGFIQRLFLGRAAGLFDRGRLRRHELVALGFGEIGIEAGRVFADKGIPGRRNVDLQREFVVAPGGLRVGGARDRRCRQYRRDQGNVFATKRAVNKGLLPIAGGFQNIVANKTERPAQIEAWSGRYFTSAAVKGLFLSSPSIAMEPAFAA